MNNALNQNLICNDQHAYRSGYSCVTQLLMTQCDYAEILDNKDCFDVIYFDFKSAFELTTHKKLIELNVSLPLVLVIKLWNGLSHF